MATLGDLVANLGINASGWNRGLSSARSSLGSFVGSVTSSLSSLGLVANGMAAIKSIGAGLTMPLTLAANAEKTQIAFSTMLKSADKAKVLVGQLNQFAASTPFEQPEIVDAGRKLLAFGVDAKNIIPTLTALGDVAAGIDQPIGELAELFGKAKVQGRLMAEDINQLTGRGIPIITELAKVFKKPETAIRGMVESGQVNFSHLQKAFAGMTGKGGQFAGLMEAQSKSTGGLWSTLKDNLGITFTQIGTALIEGFNLKGLMGQTIGFLETFRSTWLPGIAATVAAAGQSFGVWISGLYASWSAWIISSQAALYAWGDTFTAAFGQYIQYASDMLTFWKELFVGTAILFGSSWGETFDSTTGLLSYMIRNWYTLLQIAGQNVMLFASNSWQHISAFFENVAHWLDWLPGNWKSVMATLADLLMTAFINMAINIRGFFKSLYDFAAGKGFKFEATALTEGFHNSIGELPKLVTAAVDESTPELDRLYNKLGQDEAAFQKQQADRAKPPEASNMIPGQFKLAEKTRTLADIAAGNNAADVKSTKHETKHELKGVQANSAEAFRAILTGTKSGPRSAQDKMVGVQEKTVVAIDKLTTVAERQITAIKTAPKPQVAKL